MIYIIIQNELISIIVPIYNVEKYIKKCLESILMQTYTNIEIILVNDGSPDNCKQICERYAVIDNRIKLIHTENKGVSSARNTGLDKSQGNYILFVDPDDWLEVDMVEKLYINIIKNNADISICNYYEVTDNNKYGKDLLVESVFDNKKFIDYVINESCINGYIWNKLFSKNVIFNNSANRFDENIHMCEDLLFNFKVALNTKKICYTNDKLYNYLKRENSALSSSFNIRHVSKLLVFEDMIRITDRFNLDLSKRLAFEYVSDAMEIKYKMRKSKLLKKDISNYLNSIRNKNLIVALSYKNCSFIKKLKLIMKCYINYLYGSLKYRKLI